MLKLGVGERLRGEVAVERRIAGPGPEAACSTAVARTSLPSCSVRSPTPIEYELIMTQTVRSSSRYDSVLGLRHVPVRSARR